MSPRSAGPEFFVGYLPQMPPRLARRTRKVAALALVAALAGAALLAATHERLGASRFEYASPRRFTGVVRIWPCPLLAVERPREPGAAPTRSAYLVVAPGKHGAAGVLAPLEGETVELGGKLVHRGGRTMIELEPGSARRVVRGTRAEPPAREVLGRFTLVGEIVDSKCFWGVMNPGSKKPHRACAARCISGGIPPLLRVREADGAALDLLLVGPGGEPVNAEVLDLVAEPVEVTGEVVRQGEVLVLQADPRTIRRIG